MSTQIIVTRLVQVLTFTHTSLSHFLLSSTIKLKHISVPEISCYFDNLIYMNDYNMKISDCDISDT